MPTFAKVQAKLEKLHNVCNPLEEPVNGFTNQSITILKRKRNVGSGGANMPSYVIFLYCGRRLPEMEDCPILQTLGMIRRKRIFNDSSLQATDMMERGEPP